MSSVWRFCQSFCFHQQCRSVNAWLPLDSPPHLDHHQYQTLLVVSVLVCKIGTRENLCFIVWTMNGKGVAAAAAGESEHTHATQLNDHTWAVCCRTTWVNDAGAWSIHEKLLFSDWLSRQTSSCHNLIKDVAQFSVSSFLFIYKRTTLKKNLSRVKRATICERQSLASS